MITISISLEAKGPEIRPELHSQFIEFLGGCIYDGIWVGEDSDIPNYNGLRKDTVDALKKISPPVIRWPGGCYADTYHWRNGIGERKSRPITYNENFGTYEIDNNQFGTHEFMELCHLVGAKPWLNVNMMTGSAQEMRDWMEYCNREEPTTLSLERKKNGSPKPFDVELWGIGNEVWAGGGTMTAESYVNEYRKYASACPSFVSLQGGKPLPRVPIKKIASGPDGNKPKERVEWTRHLFSALGQFRCPQIDGIDLHFYNWNMTNPLQKETDFDEKDWDQVVQGCLEIGDVICEQYDLILEGIASLPKTEGFFPQPDVTCDLIIGEWGNWHGSAFYSRPALYQQCTMRDAITTALTLDIFHQNAGKLKMACVAQTVNVLNSLILTEGKTCILTPNYHVFDMYQVHRGATLLPLAFKQGTDKIFVTASLKDNLLNVSLINTDMTKAAELVLSPNAKVSFMRGSILQSADPHDYNDADHPNRVTPVAAGVPDQTDQGFLIRLPAASVQVLSFASDAIV